MSHYLVPWVFTRTSKADNSKSLTLFFLQSCGNAAQKQQKGGEQSASQAVVAAPVQETALSGTYTSTDNPFYQSLTFKGKTTVVIKDAIFGIEYPTSYERDENYIRIETDKSDLLLELTDPNTLVGEGFAKGTFIKTEK